VLSQTPESAPDALRSSLAATSPSTELDASFDALKAQVREYRPNDDLTPLECAYAFASPNHRQQVRDSGEAYMTHPLAVSRILAGMRMDVVCLITGLLHDVVEDTSVTIEEIEKNFGREVANCVNGVTKLTKLDFLSSEDRQAESFRKMLLAMTDDIRVIIVELTSRVKRAYSVYIKTQRQRIPIEQVYDLLALRIITDSVKNCYVALGVIRKEWRPVPGHIKDFIAIPRPKPLSVPTHLRIWARRPPFRSNRSAWKKCTGSLKKASRPTGNTKKGAK
jgi:(p)ppGpp synthase/HD superfamily hydrolase